MIKVKLYGGLGNQMFQYALGRHLAYKHKTKLVINFIPLPQDKLRSFKLYCFKLFSDFVLKEADSKKGTLYLKILRRVNNFLNRFQLQVKEKAFTFDSSILRSPDGAVLDGYWQSEKYFKDVEKIIRSDFEFKKPLTGKNLTTAQEIEDSQSVSVHIRRGDYVSDKRTNEVHGVCDIPYYLRAVKYIEKKLKNPKFFIFSDDIEWAKANLKLGYDSKFIDWNKGDNDYIDMQLMSLCKNNILANSSFSWWGAWLNKKSKKIVIAPKKWFKDHSIDTKDLIPGSWVRL